jgi:MYXO-CTERM domain-containing protein
MRGPTALLVLLALAPPPAAAGEHTLLVGVEDRATGAELAAALATHGGALRRCVLDHRICLVELADGPAAGTLGALPGVRWVERDRRLTPVPDDGARPGAGAVGPRPPAWDFPDVAGTAGCPELWELPLVGATLVWDLVDGSGAPVVAVQDGGFRATHRDLGLPLAGQWDYGDGDATAEVEDDVGVPQHGTFIAGLVAADPGNGVARAGLAPRGRLFLQKIADSSGAFYLSYAVAAMADLAAHPEVRILSYSLTAGYSTALEEAVAALGARGVLVVTAAGNCTSGPSCWDANNDLNPVYPGNFLGDHIVVVAGTDRADRWNPWSHYGRTTVDLAAPGVDLCSLGVGSDTETTTASGTSYATPLVAAAAALVWEAHPGLTAVELGRVLRASTHRLAELETRVRSGGRLDVAAAVATAVPRLAPPGELVVDREATLALELENAGAAGAATLVLYHGPEVELSVDSAGTGWTARPFAAADELELPDAGRVAAGGTGTLLQGPLGEHELRTLPVQTVGRSVGTAAASVRLTLASSGAIYLNAPYDTGTADPTGFLAHRFAFRVTAVPVVPPDGGPDADDGGTADADADADAPAEADAGLDLPPLDDGPGVDVPAETDADGDAAPDVPSDGDDDGGCGCRTPRSPGAPAATWLPAGLAALWLWRSRRYRANSSSRRARICAQVVEGSTRVMRK